MLLRHYLEQGVSKSALARQLGISRDTIHRWIRSGELDRDLDALPLAYTPRPEVPKKLDPFRAVIRQRLKDYPELSAVRLFEEIRASGYAGGYSRLLWLGFYERQDMPTLFRGLEEAFHFFGGVTKELLFDQMKAVITRDLRLQGQLVKNEEFLRFAAHWGFTPRACRPYRAQTKGKVERPIRYVRENFVYAREFLNDADLAEQLSRWIEKANGRVHGTTKEVPRERFQSTEQHVLLPRATRPYHSLLLRPESVAPAEPKPSAVPKITVQRRSLASYSEHASAMAGAA